MIFVLNVPRSGSTLMQVLLSSHPEVCICPETRILDYLLFESSDGLILEKSQLARLVNRCQEDEKLSGWKVDLSAFYSKLHDSRRLSIKDCVECLFGLYRDQISPGSRVIGIKKGSLLWQWRCLAELWPESKFVFTVRDPRDSVPSAIRNLPNPSLELQARKWSDRVLEATAAASRSPNIFSVVRYEDLLNSPTEVCQRLCEFLEINFVPEMIHPDQLNSDFRMIPGILEQIHSNTAKPLDRSRVSAWHAESNEAEIRRIETISRRAMTMQGYAPKFVHVNSPSVLCSQWYRSTQRRLARLRSEWRLRRQRG